MQPTKPASFRLDSIDVFRALTMFLMIFVNDFWTLEGVPRWMEHTKAAEDAMGLSDAVFPAFLFIVGLSIPFAISNRRKKGDRTRTIAFHIAERSFALLLMGIFLVNFENINGSAMAINKYVWEILMVVGFLLIWNVYPNNPARRPLYNALKLLGILILIGLAVIYKGGETESLTWMGTHWYGILGLIGWSYLLCAFAHLAAGENVLYNVLGWLFFILFNLAQFAGLLGFLDGIREYVWVVGGGSMPAMAMGGVVASVIYKRYAKEGVRQSYLLILVALGMVCLIYGFGTRPFWGISKIRATPAWVGICSGISFIAFAFLFWLVDLKKVKDWAAIFRPAGVATLTCYLVPYVWYAVITLLHISLPEILRNGWIGLVKSAIFSLLVITLTGLLNSIGIQLKI